jgi:hypothetical protein
VGPVEVAPTPTPQSKPVTRASRLVAQDIAPLVAFGLGPGVLAAGPATYRQYSYRWRLCEPARNSLPGLVAGAGIGLIPPQVTVTPTSSLGVSGSRQADGPEPTRTPQSGLGEQAPSGHGSCAEHRLATPVCIATTVPEELQQRAPQFGDEDG